jgi:hypothetical protein
MSSDDDFIPLEDDGSSVNEITPISDIEPIEELSNDQLLADAIPIDSFEDSPIEIPPASSDSPNRGGDASDPLNMEPIDLADDDADDGVNRQIRNFEKAKKTEDLSKWNRTPDPDGVGAIRCKSFVSKLRLDAIDHLDEQINAWLDEHPDYTVKHVISSVGILTGKAKEDALFINVFV